MKNSNLKIRKNSNNNFQVPDRLEPFFPNWLLQRRFRPSQPGPGLGSDALHQRETREQVHAGDEAKTEEGGEGNTGKCQLGTGGRRRRELIKIENKFLIIYAYFLLYNTHISVRSQNFILIPHIDSAMI